MRIAKQRRRENKTDYGKRLKLLTSEKPRIVFRRTNRYVIAQYVTSKNAQDKIEMGVTSKDLLKHGWAKEMEGSLKSITASYLTGFLIGKKILKSKLETPIVDAGMIRMLHKSRFYGFLKGLKDSGVGIKCDEKFFPDEERINVEKIDVEKIKKKIANE